MSTAHFAKFLGCWFYEIPGRGTILVAADLPSNAPWAETTRSFDRIVVSCVEFTIEFEHVDKQIYVI